MVTETVIRQKTVISTNTGPNYYVLTLEATGNFQEVEWFAKQLKMFLEEEI